MDITTLQRLKMLSERFILTKTEEGERNKLTLILIDEYQDLQKENVTHEKGQILS